MIANIFGSGDIHTQETIETEFEMVSDLKWYTKVVDTGWAKSGCLVRWLESFITSISQAAQNFKRELKR